MHGTTLRSITALFLGIALAAAADGPSTQASVEIAGAPVVVYDYTRDRCDTLDIPDAAARAFRDERGRVVLFASHYVGRGFVGDSLLDLHHGCHAAFTSQGDPDPAHFNFHTWLASFWTDDGRHIAALGHHESAPLPASPRCAQPAGQLCLYDAVVSLHSRDGGRSFSRSDAGSTGGPLPLAAPPRRAADYQGAAAGYFEPSNMVGAGEYRYALIGQRGIGTQGEGRCLFRSADPWQASAWEFYDGQRFVHSAGNPYAASGAHPPCAAVTGLEGALGSIARLEGSDRYVAFVIGDGHGLPEGGAVGVSSSNDLLHWSKPLSVLRVAAFWSQGCESGWKYNYPSVIDAASKSRNFDIIGREPYLFLTRADCGLGLERDLVRYKLRITG